VGEGVGAGVGDGVGEGVVAGVGNGDGFGVGAGVGAGVGHAPPGAMLTVAAQLLLSTQLVPQNRHMRGAVSIVLTHWAQPT